MRHDLATWYFWVRGYSLPLSIPICWYWPARRGQRKESAKAFRYSEELLREDYEKVAEALTEEEKYRPAVRDQGFRRAVVTAYEHRCALCGIRGWH